MARILVIDDEQPFRELLIEMLRAEGHTADGAGDGFEALQKLRAAPADVMVTDMMMPYGGLGMIRVLRGQFPGLAVIAMSGGGAHRLDYARSVGACCTLAKPFTLDQLTEAIRLALPPKDRG